MSRRAGVALVVTLATLLSLAVLALAMLGTGTRERLVAAQLERRAAVSAAAESAVRVHAAAWSTREAVRLGPGESRRAAMPYPEDLGLPGRGPPEVSLTVQRVGTALFLLRSEATLPEPGRPATVARVAALVRVLDPARLEDRFDAAALADTAILDAGGVSGSDGCGDGDGPAVRSPSPVTIAEATVRGDPPVELATLPVPLPPDPLAPPLIEGLADLRVPSGTAWPSPSTRDGVCVSAPDNWGSPTPSTPCHSHLPLVYGRGPLDVRGGRGRGILVVDGDLTLDGGFEFHGIILVSGRLLLEGDATVRGSVRATSLRTRGGRILYDRCEVRSAASAPALDRAFRPPAGWWIPAF